MKRKIIEAAAAYLSGLFFASFFNRNIFLFISFAAITLLILRLKNAVLRDFAVISVSFAVGVGYFNLYTSLTYDKIISFNGTTGSFSGEVTDIKYYNGGFASYTLKGKINNDISAKANLYTNDIGAKYGDILTVPECEFSAFENTYIFNSEDYYKSENIFLSLNNKGNVELQRRNSRKLKNFLAEYRENMTDKFKIILGEDCGGFMVGMVFGEKQAVDGNLKTALYRSGIGHILSVSGLHVSVITAFIMLILRRTGLNRFLSFIIINIFMTLLVITANSPVSAVRAMIMLDFMYSARIFYRQNDTFNSLAWAAIIICTFNPYSIYSSGFMLSFAGTFGIGVFAPYMTKNMKTDTAFRKLKFSFVTALCTSVFVFPLSMYYFDETSLISPISNIVSVPLCTVSMLIGVIYVLTGGIFPIIYGAYIFIKPVIYISKKTADMSIFHISKGGYSAYVLLSLCAVCMAVYMIFGRRKILTAVIAVSFAVFSVYSTVCSLYRHNNLIISVLGKGTDATVIISFKNSTNIIDLSGYYRSPEYAAKYLDTNGIDSVDNLILTKNINSQYSAYLSELEYHKIKNFVRTENFSLDGNFKADFENGILTVDFDNNKIKISPAKSGTNSNGLDVFYGNIPKNSKPENGIFLDEYENYLLSGMNNFEIFVYSDGVYRIRRL